MTRYRTITMSSLFSIAEEVNKLNEIEQSWAYTEPQGYITDYRVVYVDKVSDHDYTALLEYKA